MVKSTIAIYPSHLIVRTFFLVDKIGVTGKISLNASKKSFLPILYLGKKKEKRLYVHYLSYIFFYISKRTTTLDLSMSSKKIVKKRKYNQFFLIIDLSHENFFYSRTLRHSYFDIQMESLAIWPPKKLVKNLFFFSLLSFLSFYST